MRLEPSRVSGSGDFSDTRHSEIARRLEASKAAGLITDYFISWIGRDGAFTPLVRAWIDPAASEARARDQISTSLAGIIKASNLAIIMNDHSAASVLP
jgi:hypothetical protein